MITPSLQQLATDAVARLTRRGDTLATAESCTGGLIAAAITEIPGASKGFRYGWVTYCNEAKVQELAVPAKLIEEYTVVSEPVVRAMATAAQEKASARFALAVSGNAGPTAAAGEPPVGTVCIALASPSGMRSLTLFRPDLSRHDFRLMVASEALQLLLAEL